MDIRIFILVDFHHSAPVNTPGQADKFMFYLSYLPPRTRTIPASSNSPA
jgi:hypothetical protein